MKVTILNEKNRQVPTGKIGEVCIRGPNVTKGYINRPEANEEAFAGQPCMTCSLVCSSRASCTIHLMKKCCICYAHALRSY